MEEFIQYALSNARNNDDGVLIRCVCVNCLNGRTHCVTKHREYLLCDDFLKKLYNMDMT